MSQISCAWSWLLNFILRWLYTRSIVIDGNFSADHLKMKHPANDVGLNPGSRYMVEPTRYQAHLESAVDHREVSDFTNDHVAWNLILLRNRHVPTTRQSIGLIPHRDTFKPQELELLHVLDMGVSSRRL